jgi:hypothetical protein
MDTPRLSVLPAAAAPSPRGGVGRAAPKGGVGNNSPQPGGKPGLRQTGEGGCGCDGRPGGAARAQAHAAGANAANQVRLSQAGRGRNGQCGAGQGLGAAAWRHAGLCRWLLLAARARRAPQCALPPAAWRGRRASNDCVFSRQPLKKALEPAGAKSGGPLKCRIKPPRCSRPSCPWPPAQGGGGGRRKREGRGAAAAAWRALAGNRLEGDGAGVGGAFAPPRSARRRPGAGAAAPGPLPGRPLTRCCANI